MAKKRSSGPNKSQAIREYYSANPSAKPMEVATELKKQGIKVTPAFVSTIRSTSKKKKGKIGKPGRPPGSSGKRQSTGGEISIDSLLRVKAIVEEVGGIEEARIALSALEKLVK